VFSDAGHLTLPYSSRRSPSGHRLPSKEQPAEASVASSLAGAPSSYAEPPVRRLPSTLAAAAAPDSALPWSPSSTTGAAGATPPGARLARAPRKLWPSRVRARAAMQRGQVWLWAACTAVQASRRSVVQTGPPGSRPRDCLIVFYFPI
jgi:hypothetical protein